MPRKQSKKRRTLRDLVERDERDRIRWYPDPRDGEERYGRDVETRIGSARSPARGHSRMPLRGGDSDHPWTWWRGA